VPRPWTVAGARFRTFPCASNLVAVLLFSAW